jgi:hypothetical protein
MSTAYIIAGIIVLAILFVIIRAGVRFLLANSAKIITLGLIIVACFCGLWAVTYCRSGVDKSPVGIVGATIKTSKTATQVGGKLIGSASDVAAKVIDSASSK